MAPRLVSTGINELLPMQRSGQPESHISHLIRNLCVRLGHFEDEDPDMDDADRARRQTRWELGSAFERAVIGGLAARHADDDPHRFAIPGELEHDGLIGSPDLLDIPDQTVIEIKLTWMSSRHDPESEKFWKYWVQGKAYAHMIGWNTVRVHAGHVMGNYKDDRGPIYNIWEDTFTDQQLLENWTMLLNERRRIQRVDGK